MSKNKKIIIGILIAVLLIISVVVVYKVIEKSVTNRVDFNFKVDNNSSIPVDTVNNKEKYKKIISIGKPAMKPLYYILYKS